MSWKRKDHPEMSNFDHQGRELLLSDPAAITHALYCQSCGLREQAELALALVGWDEVDYLEAITGRVARSDIHRG